MGMLNMILRSDEEIAWVQDPGSCPDAVVHDRFPGWMLGGMVLGTQSSGLVCGVRVDLVPGVVMRSAGGLREAQNVQRSCTESRTVGGS
jgi:hypothetical protein